jgi:hypothetical protein
VVNEHARRFGLYLNIRRIRRCSGAGISVGISTALNGVTPDFLYDHYENDREIQFQLAAAAAQNHKQRRMTEAPDGYSQTG